MHASRIPSTDPSPAPSPDTSGTYPTAEGAARARALRLGHKMAPGGILRDASGGMICRGWRLYASAATAAGDILATAGGYELPPAPAAPPAQPPAAPPAVAVRVPTLPAVRPLRLEAPTEDEDEGEDSPTLPGVPDLPGAVASPGQDEVQPDRGDRAPLPSGPGGREDSPAESPDGGGDREDEGEDIEIIYYPEIGERSRTLVDAHDHGAALEAILFCGAAPVLAALGGASSPATCATPTATTCPSSSSSSRCASSRRPLGERQRYAVCASRCAAARRRRARLVVVASSAAPSVPTTTSHRPPARARGVARDADAADGRPSALAAEWQGAFPQTASA